MLKLGDISYISLQTGILKGRLMTENFSYLMEQHPFEAEPLSKELIIKALDLVFEDAIAGYNNFFVLQNDSNGYFIQTIFQDGIWRVEYSDAKGIIYKKDEIDYKNVYAVFQNFYRGIEPDLCGYKGVNINDL